MRKRVWKKLVNRFDIFGQTMSFTFRGDDKFQTSFGLICSFFVLLLILFIFSMKSVQFRDQRGSLQMINQIPFRDQTLNLTDLKFKFMIQDVDERVGRIEVLYRNYSTEGRFTQEIEMMPCEQLIDKDPNKLK